MMKQALHEFVIDLLEPFEGMPETTAYQVIIVALSAVLVLALYMLWLTGQQGI